MENLNARNESVLQVLVSIGDVDQNLIMPDISTLISTSRGNVKAKSMKSASDLGIYISNRRG